MTLPPHYGFSPHPSTDCLQTTAHSDSLLEVVLLLEHGPEGLRVALLLGALDAFGRTPRLGGLVHLQHLVRGRARVRIRVRVRVSSQGQGQWPVVRGRAEASRRTHGAP